MNLMRRYGLTLLLCLLPWTTALAERPSYTCYRMPADAAITIDGDLSDWPSFPVMLIGKPSQVASGSWHGPNDTLAKVSIAWDEQTLYMAIDVVDDVVTQRSSMQRASLIYTNDSIQWAVDLNNDGGDHYQSDNYEYGFGVADGKPVAYRWFSGGSGWPKGLAEHIDLAVKRTSTGLVYEAAIAKQMINPFKPEDGLEIGFCLVLQDRDAERSKSIQWSPGIVSGKKPSDFGKLIFSTASPSMGDSSVLVSAADQAGAHGLDVRVIAVKPIKTLAYQLKDTNGDVIGKGLFGQDTQDPQMFVSTIDTATLKPGVYAVDVQGSDARILSHFTFERASLDGIHALETDNQRKAEKLTKLVEMAEAAGVQTYYAKSVLAVNRLFNKYTQEDLKQQKYKLAHHNLQSINDTLSLRTSELTQWLADKEGTPEIFRLPELDYTKTRRVGPTFYVDNQPVLLGGPGGWLWGMNKDVPEIGDIGFNQMSLGLLGKDQFDKQGEMIPEDKIAWWAVHDIKRAAREKRMALGILMFAPEHITMGMTRSGKQYTIQETRQALMQLMDRKIPRLGRGRIFDYIVGAETRRAIVEYEPSEHHGIWVDYLQDTYSSIDQFNKIWKTDYADFKTVAFPKPNPVSPAQQYDRTRMRQIMIAREMSWVADQIRQRDPGVLVDSYPYSWSARKPAVYHERALDIELDTANHDIVGCDSSGPQQNERYAMATIDWMAGFYDLVHSMAGDRPVMEGEFHFANRRKIYPENWSRAIYFQSYIHGLSASYAWVWQRSGKLDAAMLLDANVLMQAGQAMLDMRRLAPQVIAFHRQPLDVAILYVNPSTPHTRRENDLLVSQTSQTNAVYEGLFFQGLHVGFVTEKQLQKGLLDHRVPVIIPNSSHVHQSTRDAIERFARSGGRVAMVGQCLEFTPQSQPLETFPKLKSVQRFDPFVDPDQARQQLIPYLQSVGIESPFDIRFENQQKFPTVEWQRATGPDGRELLYLLNIGHGPAKVTLPTEFDNATDLLTGQQVSREFELDKLGLKLIRVANTPGLE